MISILLIDRYLLIFSKYKIHYRSGSKLAVGPDFSTVILDDLFYDGKADTASPLGRIPGRICPVKTVKNIRQILGRNAFSVILDLYLDKVTHVPHTDTQITLGFIQIFDGIADDVVDDTLDLLCVCNDQRILVHIIKNT